MISIHHEDYGEGYPIVLLHGFCETLKIWRGIAIKLSDTFRVMIPDLPGFGDSPLLQRPFSIEDVGRAIFRWMDDLRVPESVVIGHSLGGYVALAMARINPERLAGIGLFHSTAYPDNHEKKTNRNKTIGFVRSHGVAPFVETFVPGLFHQKDNPGVALVHEMAMATTVSTLVSYAEAMRDRPSSVDVLENFPRPILMVAGEQDAITPYGPSSEQTAKMRFPFFKGLTNVGHMGMFENEQESLLSIRDFAAIAIDFGKRA